MLTDKKTPAALPGRTAPFSLSHPMGRLIESPGVVLFQNLLIRLNALQNGTEVVIEVHPFSAWSLAETSRARPDLLLVFDVRAPSTRQFMLADRNFELRFLRFDSYAESLRFDFELTLPVQPPVTAQTGLNDNAPRL